MFAKRLVVLILSCWSLMSFGQQSVSTAYSRYAFGELNQRGMSSYFGMGGASIAMADSFLVNINNPASYAFLMPHRPLFDLGVSGQFVRSRSLDAEETDNAVALHNIVLGIPVSQRAGFAIGITPFSSVGYYMADTNTDATFGEIRTIYEGDGGLNKAFLGIGYKPVSNKELEISLGAQASYLFGRIHRERKAIFSDIPNALHTKVIENINVSDFAFDGGLFAKWKIRDTAALQFGATYSLARDINATMESLSHTFFLLSTESLVDTVAFQDSLKGYLSIPQKLGLGLSYEIQWPVDGGANSRLVFATQMEIQNWSNYREAFGNSVINDSLKDSRSFSFGIQYTPYNSALIKQDIGIWRLTNYRIGFRYSDTYLQLRNTAFKQYGISFGFGIPLIQSASFSSLQLGMELGKRGTTENGLLEENYMNFQVGISISPWRNDGWFYKRKYD